jgi:hypothetical protein
MLAREVPLYLSGRVHRVQRSGENQDERCRNIGSAGTSLPGFLLRQNLLGHFADQSEAGAQAVIVLCAMERVCTVALRYLVLNVLMGLDTPSFTPVAPVDSTV